MRAALLSRVAAPRCLNDGHDSFLPLIDGKQLMPRILGVPFRSRPRGGHGPDHRSIDILARRLARLEAFLALPQAPRELPDQTLAKVAEALYRARRRRARHLPNELLGEPAWDILLDLFSPRRAVSDCARRASASPPEYLARQRCVGSACLRK